MSVDWVGWLATAVFMSSYVSKRPATLRRVQAGAAGLWALYGILIHALPIIVANVLVAAVALGTSFGKETRTDAGASR